MNTLSLPRLLLELSAAHVPRCLLPQQVEQQQSVLRASMDQVAADKMRDLSEFEELNQSHMLLQNLVCLSPTFFPSL